MFCRCCYYDLRGQETPRCPECGTPFAFDDPSSFLGEEPRSLAQMLLWARHRRRVLLVVLSVLLLISYGVALFTLPSFTNPVHPTVLAAVNLKAVITTWMIQQYEHPEQTTFDVNGAKQDMAPSLSPWSEGRAARRREFVRRLLTVAPYFVVPTMTYLLAVVFLARRQARRGILVLLVALSSLLCCSLYARDVAAWLCPGTHAFLDDYVYLPGVDFTGGNPERGRTIVAYDAQTFRGPTRRIIAFADGHVMSFSDVRARAVFEAQGIPYPDLGD